MTWYTASIKQAIKLKEGDQNIYPVYEDYVLVEADTVKEANKMTWYTASIIQAIKLKEGDQNIYPVYEDYVLVEADTVKEAFEKAELIGKKVSEIDDQLTLNNKPAKMVCMGIRKLIEIRDPLFVSDELRSMDKPRHGTEVSYSYMEVDSEEKLNRLVDGKAVEVWYIDTDDNST